MLPRIVMNYLLDHPLVLMAGLVVLLIAAFEIGHRGALKSGLAGDEERYKQYKVVRDALSVLLSLLLGFTLAMSVSRFDHRRDLVVQEANAISTTYLRSQLLAQPHAAQIQDLLRKYVAAREAFFDAGLDGNKLQAAEAETGQLQQQLWEQCTQVTQVDRTSVATSFVQALNETIDLDAARLAALEYRVPAPVWTLIIVVAFFEMVAQGAAAKKRFLFPMFALPLIVAIVCALVADLDASRSGLIKVDQQSMQRVKAQLGAGK
jgi:hypothetical protein